MPGLFANAGEQLASSIENVGNAATKLGFTIYDKLNEAEAISQFNVGQTNLQDQLNQADYARTTKGQGDFLEWGKQNEQAENDAWAQTEKLIKNPLAKKKLADWFQQQKIVRSKRVEDEIIGARINQLGGDFEYKRKRIINRPGPVDAKVTDLTQLTSQYTGIGVLHDQKAQLGLADDVHKLYVNDHLSKTQAMMNQLGTVKGAAWGYDPANSQGIDDEERQRNVESAIRARKTILSIQATNAKEQADESLSSVRDWIAENNIPPDAINKIMGKADKDNLKFTTVNDGGDVVFDGEGKRQQALEAVEAKTKYDLGQADKKRKEEKVDAEKKKRQETSEAYRKQREDMTNLKMVEKSNQDATKLKYLNMYDDYLQQGGVTQEDINTITATMKGDKAVTGEIKGWLDSKFKVTKRDIVVEYETQFDDRIEHLKPGETRESVMQELGDKLDQEKGLTHGDKDEWKRYTAVSGGRGAEKPTFPQLKTYGVLAEKIWGRAPEYGIDDMMKDVNKALDSHQITGAQYTKLLGYTGQAKNKDVSEAMGRLSKGLIHNDPVTGATEGWYNSEVYEKLLGMTEDYIGSQHDDKGVSTIDAQKLTTYVDELTNKTMDAAISDYLNGAYTSPVKFIFTFGEKPDPAKIATALSAFSTKDTAATTQGKATMNVLKIDLGEALAKKGIEGNLDVGEIKSGSLKGTTYPAIITKEGAVYGYFVENGEAVIKKSTDGETWQTIK